MTWATEEDLLHGDMDLGSIDTQFYLDRAQDEIEVWLGGYYLVDATFPTVSGTLGGVPPLLSERMHKALRLTQARIATGRMIMAQCAGDQDESLNAYGLWLLGLGMEDMMKFGVDWLIDGATKASGKTAASLIPSIHQPHARSPFERYEKEFYNDTDGPSFEETTATYRQWVITGG